MIFDWIYRVAFLYPYGLDLVFFLYRWSRYNGKINMINAIVVLFALNAVASTASRVLCWCCRFFSSFRTIYEISNLFYIIKVRRHVSQVKHTDSPLCKGIFTILFCYTHQNFTCNYHFASNRVYLFVGSNLHENRKKLARFNSHFLKIKLVYEWITHQTTAIMFVISVTSDILSNKNSLFSCILSFFYRRETVNKMFPN